MMWFVVYDVSFFLIPDPLFISFPFRENVQFIIRVVGEVVVIERVFIFLLSQYCSRVLLILPNVY